MKVLALSHTGQVSGAEHSLLGLLSALPPGVEVTLACPSGPLLADARRAGIAVREVAGTQASLRLTVKGVTSALAEIAAGGAGLARVIRALRPDVIHANSIRSGLIAALPGRAMRVPIVVHVRDALPPGRGARAIQRLVGRSATIVVANSQYTAQRFAAASGRRDVAVVFNAIDLERFDAAAAAAPGVDLGLNADDGPVLAVIGQITPWKGQDDAIRALAIVRRTHPAAVLLIIGEAKFVAASTRYDNQAYLAELRAIAGRLGVSDAVHLLGERHDVPEILPVVDALLVPSWEEPFGRVVIEGLAAGVPVVSTNVGGPAEIVRHESSGLLVGPRDPAALAAEVLRVLDDASLRATLVATGLTRARQFDLPAHAAAMVSVYEAARRG